MGDDPRSQDGVIKVATAVAASLLVSAAVSGVVLWRDASNLAFALARVESDIVRISAAVESLSARLVVCDTHRSEHEKESERFRRDIERNRSSIEDLRRKPEARPDPFTGTEGRELDRRLRQLESR